MKALIDYKSLRKISPETARTAVLQYLSGSGNISQTAKAFGLQRAVIYNIIKRSGPPRQLAGGGLKDLSRAPKKIANKTIPNFEKMIVEIYHQTGFGPKRLLKILKQKRLNIPYGTLRGILRRNRKTTS